MPASKQKQPQKKLYNFIIFIQNKTNYIFI
nr:MAG TPA: hypothetical protein [Caudoviricetes sp.]